MSVHELNIDGLVGPTHHYAGLAEGNIASTENALTVANPQAAALQGLAKMRYLHNLGLKQALLPPHARPNLNLLRQLGFTGSVSKQLNQAHTHAPRLLSACYSASSMWTANAATVSPSIDTRDGKVHFTAANLIGNLHRHQEADFTRSLLKIIFQDSRYFHHHPLAPKSVATSDEGAANHNRLCRSHGDTGLYVFVYGKHGLNGLQHEQPKKYPARQTLEASQAIARSHQLRDDRVVYARQHPEAIDAGVFHNDVISVANESVFLVHERAFADQQQTLAELANKADFALNIIEINQQDLSLEEAVRSYLFNSQLITLPNQRMALIAPSECEDMPRVNAFIERLLNDSSNPIDTIHYFDLKQSMQNGGGPACLRLRVPLSDREIAAMHQGILVNDELLDDLTEWVKQHYRTSLHADDLRDPSLIDESFTALDRLTQRLNLGSIYPFQQK